MATPFDPKLQNWPAAQFSHGVAELSSSSVVPAAQVVHVAVVSVNDPAAQSMHLSVIMDEAETPTLKVPGTQPVHPGCTVVEPIVAVYVPATHLVCVSQASVTMDEADTPALKLPEAQTVHTG